jgi:hypothetical protein
MKTRFEVAFAATDVAEILRKLHAMRLPASDLPARVWSDGKERKIGDDWLERWMLAAKLDAIARWSDGARVRFDRNSIVKMTLEGYTVETKRTLRLAADLPFTVGSNSSLYPAWEDGSVGEKYSAPSFGDLHWPHGWACFFKGDGHRRLVSRRWIDFGPWRVVRGAGDTTMVQFHDLEADAETALEQAKPAHRRMGISREGGFIQTGFVYAHELEGRYFAEKRRLDIVVNGRSVSQSEMLDACALRLYQRLGPDKPVDNVAYTFVREEEARAHLHELWLRELECWAIVKGREVRLDLDYHPTPTPPAWVLEVEARAASMGGT